MTADLTDVIHLVVCDASFRAGHAGLGITGVLGPHAKYEPAKTSGMAEIQAVLWAMDLAEGRLDTAVFASDCTVAACWHRGKFAENGSKRPEAAGRSAIRRRLKRQPGWKVIQVTNRATRDADRLARNARESYERLAVSFGTAA
jgi:hypothetical protein